MLNKEETYKKLYPDMSKLQPGYIKQLENPQETMTDFEKEIYLLIKFIQKLFFNVRSILTFDII